MPVLHVESNKTFSSIYNWFKYRCPHTGYEYTHTITWYTIIRLVVHNLSTCKLPICHYKNLNAILKYLLWSSWLADTSWAAVVIHCYWKESFFLRLSLFPPIFLSWLQGTLSLEMIKLVDLDRKNYSIFFFAGLVLCRHVELSATLEHKHSIWTKVNREDLIKGKRWNFILWQWQATVFSEWAALRVIFVYLLEQFFMALWKFLIKISIVLN